MKATQTVKKHVYHWVYLINKNSLGNNYLVTSTIK